MSRKSVTYTHTHTHLRDAIQPNRGTFKEMQTREGFVHPLMCVCVCVGGAVREDCVRLIWPCVCVSVCVLSNVVSSSWCEEAEPTNGLSSSCWRSRLHPHIDSRDQLREGNKSPLIKCSSQNEPVSAALTYTKLSFIHT